MPASFERGSCTNLLSHNFTILNINNAGILRMLYFTAVSSHAVTSTLTIFTLPAYSFERSSRTGAIALQGAHQPAKSQQVQEFPASKTSAWKFFISCINNSRRHGLLQI